MCVPPSENRVSGSAVVPYRRQGDGDEAGGGARVISLSAPGFLPWLCCQIPAFCLFSLMLVTLVAAIFAQEVFYMITAFFTLYATTWITSLSLSSAYGALKLRRSCATDWHEKLEKFQQEDPDGTEYMHIVILPNYKEHEHMLQETLENIGQAPDAAKRIRIVLGMEGREEEGRLKAERLINKCSHLFHGMIAAHHPHGIKGELAGKSSNTQWAYKEALRAWEGDFSNFDTSKIFLTVGDADTLWHPQFFSALAYEGLTMSDEARRWSIFQPSILLLRNLFSVPGPTRVSAFGTLLFELAGMTNQALGSHFSYSAYSLTLALAMHPSVRGWDADVIAEDHHMFCKCYFASIWDAAARGPAEKLTPKVQLRGIFLPAMSYLVEGEGWLDSCQTRFQQARRHSQGIAELGYVLLQYANLLLAHGPWRLPVATHAKILSIAWKMHTVHVTNAVQAFSLVLGLLVGVPKVLAWLLSGGPAALAAAASSQGLLGAVGIQSFQSFQWALLAAFGPAAPVMVLCGSVSFFVVRDTLNGRYWRSCKTRQFEPPAIQGAPKETSSDGCSGLGWFSCLSIFLSIQNDYALLAEPTIVAYGLAPVTMACWSVMRKGPSFEYIVAEKPNSLKM